MKVVYDPQFLRALKKTDIRIRKRVKERTLIFSENPNAPELNNHELRREWKGFRSIDITADWRAIYEEVYDGDEIVAYFVALGTHEQLYRKKLTS